jgi:hypothetical protein
MILSRITGETKKQVEKPNKRRYTFHLKKDKGNNNLK